MVKFLDRLTFFNPDQNPLMEMFSMVKKSLDYRGEGGGWRVCEICEGRHHISNQNQISKNDAKIFQLVILYQNIYLHLSCYYIIKLREFFSEYQKKDR